ncbi:hypothetical protein CC1G_10711 [Coprinopsis cinerea okayama7|uniref:Uncharacterized protein n=1 Tax=Coprinopsis cinerea (strain Okayama-7 / 130 / ATCC MYA-4618 / FGSC 9003) TaxID=240176 RepID=A8NBD0_COPC7|nr:hypothetical protein CC1G_10711 [Coprinopsis cinerea okayama7\|eukprot:XP_001832129.1 hypothetical protein CC1G_10711 [Coprinopsis cinerea okayama7\
MGFGLGFKRNSRTQPTKSKAEDDDQWYIPYTGSFEPPPREPPRRLRPRDSWGDPLDPDDDDDEGLADKELQERFREYGDTSSRNSSKFTDDDHKPRGRDRSFSLMSGRTVSSGMVDPSRNSVLSPRRSTVTSGQRPPVPSYIHLEAAGGVGESPVPHVTKEHLLSNRLSLASIFSFASSSRKNRSSPERSRKSSLRRARPPKSESTSRQPSEPNTRPSTSSEAQDSTTKKKLVFPQPDPSKLNDVAPDDYYNSYYSTLVQTPGHESSPLNHQGEVPSTQTQEDPATSPHPYAYIPLQDPSDPPQSAPLPTTSSTQSNKRPPRLGFTNPGNNSLGVRSLKNSTSTPDLRLPAPPRSKSRTSPSIKDRWLSAESWCDAILFPRPRFKQVAPPPPRIVSPPDTPVEEKFHDQVADSAVPSRVLAHSKSLGNLKPPQPPLPQVAITPPPEPTPTAKSSNARPPRPKSFAADDLALINPAFSLEQVLQEGEKLEFQRRQWQVQATSSIGNSTARKLARSRSKSLTQKGRKVQIQNSIDYLAARACLGSQNASPDILPPRPRTSSSTHGTQSMTTAGRPSHSHSNSLTKSLSLSKSSKHSRGHSRSESWSKGDNKHPRVPAAEINHTRPSLEVALHNDNTRVIRFPDPAFIPIDRSSPARVSPIPSGSSDIHMGIAISTPPPPDDGLDRESIRMPAHPYASAGLYTRSNPAQDTTQEKKQPERSGADYAGPHPIVAPHNNHQPPRVSSPMSSHPYARAVSPESAAFVAQPRDDSNVPVSDKMWAQLSPGIVREVLPDDLVYSPFMQDTSAADGAGDDSVGLGEALTYTNSYRDSFDSGLGTSEGHVIQPYVPVSSPQEWQEEAPRVHRKPVQYDASRPAYPQRPGFPHHRHNSSSDDPASSGAAALPSSDLLLPIPEVVDHNGVVPSPGATSGTPSPPPSPRSLGSPNDLDNFHDLFYQPSSIRQSALDPVADRPLSQSASLTWEEASRSRRTGSGLTSLARQLSEEFEQMERDRASSQYSTGGSLRQDSLGRKTANGGLEFVFEEVRTDSPTQMGHVHDHETDEDPTLRLKPPFSVPEDVASFVASSAEGRTVEDEEDETAVFRVGSVDAIATPPAETADRRRSFIGLMSYDNRFPRDPSISPDGRHLSQYSGLQPPEITRSSYMTTSTMSRMSGLSDFPVPPRDPAHMSLLTAYFDETLSHREMQALRDTPHPLSPEAGRLVLSETSESDVKPANSTTTTTNTTTNTPSTD